MSELHEYAKNELNIFINSGERYENLIAEDILELIDVFSKQDHSNFSAQIVLEMFYRLANFLPLSPLTGKDDEWYDNGQNKRCFHVFKDETGVYDYDTQEILKKIQGEIRNIDDIEIVYGKTYIGAFEVDKILEKYINKENKDE